MSKVRIKTLEDRINIIQGEVDRLQQKLNQDRQEWAELVAPVKPGDIIQSRATRQQMWIGKVYLGPGEPPRWMAHAYNLQVNGEPDKAAGAFHPILYRADWQACNVRFHLIFKVVGHWAEPEQAAPNA